MFSAELPDNVSLDLVNHTGPMLEARQYTLQCAVWDVAPVQNLTVTFYRGDKPLGSLQSAQHSDCRRPMNETFTLSIEPSRDDDQAQYWCEARLDLKAAGQQRPLVVSSQKYTATVFCELNCRFASSLVYLRTRAVSDKTRTEADWIVHAGLP